MMILPKKELLQKTIEDGNKGSNFTGIVFGASSSYINPYDDSSEGKIGIVANGVTTVIASQEGLIPGGGASGEDNPGTGPARNGVVNTGGGAGAVWPNGGTGGSGIILVKEAGGIVNDIDMSKDENINVLASSTEINEKLIQNLTNF